MQLDIFGNAKFETPSTEGIKYAGSKLKLLPFIIDMVSGLEVMNVLDGFSGSTRVSQAFAKLGFNTTSSDISEWSETFAKCYLLNHQQPKYYEQIIQHLNSLKGYDGWYTENYGGSENQGTKRPFQRKNTQKLDAIRDEIDNLGLNDIEKAVILTSLINALDAVDSTLGHYVSYLAAWSPRSYNDLVLQVPKLFSSNGKHRVIKGDIFETVQENTFDFVYFDPPYGSNNEKMPPSRVRYSAYYHIWTTIIRNDKPELFGKANRRVDTRDQNGGSVFEEFRRDNDGHYIALQAIMRLIKDTKARYILLSYSSGGRATRSELTDILNNSGKIIRAINVDYKKNVMGGMRWTNEWINSDGDHHEYLFLLEKNGI